MTKKAVEIAAGVIGVPAVVHWLLLKQRGDGMFVLPTVRFIRLFIQKFCN
jgi:hypothetical protein